MMKENAAVAGGCCSAGGMLPRWEGAAVAGGCCHGGRVLLWQDCRGCSPGRRMLWLQEKHTALCTAGPIGLRG